MACWRSQSLLYVLPSQPQTGRICFGQNRGIFAQVPDMSRMLHAPAFFWHNWPASHWMPPMPPHIFPTPTAFAPVGTKIISASAAASKTTSLVFMVASLQRLIFGLATRGYLGAGDAQWRPRQGASAAGFRRARPDGARFLFCQKCLERFNR